VKHKTNLLTRHGVLTLMFLLTSIIAFAQTAPQDLSGTYEGMVKLPDAREVKVTLELKSEGGKISGRLIHDNKPTEITEGKLENGTLTLKFDKQRTLIAKVDGDKLAGEAIDGAQKIPIEFKKVTPVTGAAAAPVASPATAPAPAAVNLNGNWDAVADANGQPFPFALTLKVDGETVTGSSSSQLGESIIKAGTWKDGKLAFTLEGQNGAVTLSAVVVDGKLSGEFDFSGQLQGKWVAVKKN
jgi:hypothetical protein